MTVAGVARGAPREAMPGVNLPHELDIHPRMGLFMAKRDDKLWFWLAQRIVRPGTDDLDADAP